MIYLSTNILDSNIIKKIAKVIDVKKETSISSEGVLRVLIYLSTRI